MDTVHKVGTPYCCARWLRHGGDAGYHWELRETMRLGHQTRGLGRMKRYIAEAVLGATSEGIIYVWRY